MRNQDVERRFVCLFDPQKLEEIEEASSQDASHLLRRLVRRQKLLDGAL